MDQNLVSPITSEANQPVPPLPPKNNSGLFIGILVFILGILVGLVIDKTTLLSSLRIPYLSVTPTQTPIPSPAVVPGAAGTQEGTANWKTYTNDKYGFSFKYPENAKYEVTHATNTEFNIMLSNLTGLPYEELVIYVGNNWAYTNTNADKVKNFIVDGISAYRENLPLGQNPPQSLVYVKHGAYYFTIQQTKDPKDPVIDQTFTQILSTFKFVDQNNQGSQTNGQHVNCPATRPQVCSMLCIQPPPYLCGSDGKSYCSECQACSNTGVSWYVTQDSPCTSQ
jgi:hypothetical protein